MTISYIRVLPRIKVLAASVARQRQCRDRSTGPAASHEETVPLSFDLLETLFIETQAISDAQTVEEASEQALDILSRHVPCESAAVLAAGINDTALRFTAATGPSADEVAALSVPMDAGFAGRAYQDGSDFLIDDAARDGRHLDSIDAATGYRTRSMLVSPLIDGDFGMHGCIELLDSCLLYTSDAADDP